MRPSSPSASHPGLQDLQLDALAAQKRAVASLELARDSLRHASSMIGLPAIIADLKALTKRVAEAKHGEVPT